MMAHHSDNQPRIPAGNPGAGRWTKNVEALARDIKKREEARLIYDTGEHLSHHDNENVYWDDFSSYPTVHLPREEYAMVMHELATNLTKEEYSAGVAIRDISNYTYTAEIKGLCNFRIIGKNRIKATRRGRKWSI